METLQFIVRKLLYSIPLIIGATLISFVLMVYYGPDKTYELLGKNPTKEQIVEVRHQLGYDRPFLVRYTEYLKQLITMDFGNSDSTGEKVGTIFWRSIPITLALEIPVLVLGDGLAILIALLAAHFRGRWLDKWIMFGSVVGMSISLLIVLIGFQIVFCSSYGLDLFPVQGWEVNSLGDYFNFVTVPAAGLIFVALGYNTRFFRAVIVEEMHKDHVRTAKAFGCPPVKLLLKHVLKNSLIPIVTRIMYTIPFIIIGGSLVAESIFGIPGVGLITYNAITSGDQPILKAVVGLSALLYVVALTLTDIIYQLIDPRISVS